MKVVYLLHERMSIKQRSESAVAVKSCRMSLLRRLHLMSQAITAPPMSPVVRSRTRVKALIQPRIDAAAAADVCCKNSYAAKQAILSGSDRIGLDSSSVCMLGMYGLDKNLNRHSSLQHAHRLGSSDTL